MYGIRKRQTEQELNVPIDIYFKRLNRNDVLNAWHAFGSLEFDSSDISYESSQIPELALDI